MRIRTIITAAAVPAALAATLLGTAAAASAAPVPGNGNSVVEINTQSELDAITVNGVINKNIDFPAGSQVGWLQWTTVNGNVSVEGQLQLSADNIQGNVTVSGPGSLGFSNYASEIHGNLTVTGSSGQYAGSWVNADLGDWTSYAGGVAGLPTAQSQIDGGLTITGNTAASLTNNMSGGGQLHVHGKFTYSGNSYNGTPLPYQGGLQVDGKSVIS
jgi:hypothetical protein